MDLKPLDPAIEKELGRILETDDSRLSASELAHKKTVLACMEAHEQAPNAAQKNFLACKLFKIVKTPIQ